MVSSDVFNALMDMYRILEFVMQGESFVVRPKDSNGEMTWCGKYSFRRLLIYVSKKTNASLLVLYPFLKPAD